MRTPMSLAVASVVFLSPAFSGYAVAGQKLTIAHSTWIGYGALYIAKEEGLFEKAGLDVDLKVIEASSDALAAMQGGQIDVVASTVDNFSLFAGNGAKLSLLMSLDESNGGDGIVSKKEIATVADLKGRTVGVQKGSISQFLLAQALDKAGLTINDVNAIDMKSGDAGAAFVAGSIDAAVTWQPWLGKAAANSGKVLIDTKSMPGLIVDALATRTDFAKEHSADLKAFVKAYFEGVAFMQANPEKANEIIARNLKMSKDTLEGTLKDVRFFNAKNNADFFAGTDSPAVKLVTSAGEFYRRIGVLRAAPDVQAIVGLASDIAK